MPTYRPLPAVGKPEPVSTYGNTQNAHGTRSAGNNLAARINRFIASTHPNAPMAGMGEMLVRVGREEGVDPRVLTIIARKESEYGTTSGKWKFNAYGLGVNSGDPSLYLSRSWEEGTRKAARNLVKGDYYKRAGKTRIDQIVPAWAPPQENDTATYIRQLSQWYREMGGNPNANVFSPAAVGGDGGGGGGGRRGRQPRGAGSRDTQPVDDAPGTKTFQTAGSYRPGMVAIAPRTLALMQQYVDQSEADVMQGYMPGDVEPVLSGIDFDYRPPKVTPGEMLTVPGDAGQGQTRRAASAPGGNANQPRLTLGGGPGGGTHSRSEGGYQWQDDDAYDLMGTAGARIHSPFAGTVTRISGKPGGNPRYAGYGITIKTPQGSFFFKHLGSKNVKVGDRIRPGQLIGTLDGTVQGGAHLHLGATNVSALKNVIRYYTNPARSAPQRTRRAASTGGGGLSSAPRPGGGWGGSEGPAREMARIAAQSGLTITSSKRDRQSTASGGVSDHWTGKRNAYAVDLGWGGSRPTHESDVAASRIVRALGGPRNWGLTGGVFNRTVNGLRYQVIYRSDVGDNHWNHIHVGVQRV